MRKHNKELTPYAKKLRKAMTLQERKLWYEFLHDYSIRILRQKVIADFIADFYCARAKLVIELDGSQHFCEEAIEVDRQRTEIFKEFGIEVLRFSNRDIIENFEGVCQRIDETIQRRLVSNPTGAVAPPPFGKGGREGMSPL